MSRKKFSDAGIQDISTSISIEVRICKNINDLTERYEDDDDDESDKHLEARDRRYSCLINLKTVSRSGNEVLAHHRGLADFEFQTGNSLNILQK